MPRCVFEIVVVVVVVVVVPVRLHLFLFDAMTIRSRDSSVGRASD